MTSSHDRLRPTRSAIAPAMTARTQHPLEELDRLTVHVIVDNELDPLSPGPTSSAVQQSGGILDVALRGAPLDPELRSGACREIRMDGICCGAHGLSLLVTGEKEGRRARTVLFDAGPEEDVWQRNARRLGLVEAVGRDLERVVLSHWHRDHSGGLLEVLRTAAGSGRVDSESAGRPAVVMDVHPDRPSFRGFRPPGMAPFSVEADPTFEQMESAGAKVEKHGEAHTVLDNMFLVSGEIPRETDYEKGVRYGVRLDEKNGQWIEDEAITDERLLMCRVKGMLPSHDIC